MGGQVHLLVLAGIAIFLVWRLLSLLGTRQGFEKPAARVSVHRGGAGRDFEVIDGDLVDNDIDDHVVEGSPESECLHRMKAIEPEFNVTEFLQGARQVYEMILVSFDKGTLEDVEEFLDAEVQEAFAEAREEVDRQGLEIESEILGIRDVAIEDAEFDESERRASVTVRFVAEIRRVVRDANGEVVDGDPKAVGRRKDVWTFTRIMGTDDPVWLLEATD